MIGYIDPATLTDDPRDLAILARPDGMAGIGDFFRKIIGGAAKAIPVVGGVIDALTQPKQQPAQIVVTAPPPPVAAPGIDSKTLLILGGVAALVLLRR